MKTSVVTFAKPEGVVSMSNISIDIKNKQFSLSLGFIPNKKRKAIVQQITGGVSHELMDWLTKAYEVEELVESPDGPIKVKTGEIKTPFQRYLQKRGIEFKPGILNTMTFTGKNDSESYEEFPLKVVMYIKSPMLTLVNVAPKKKTSTVNINTGEITESWKNNYFVGTQGNLMKSFFTPKNYRRYVIQNITEQTIAKPTEQLVEQHAEPAVN